MTPAPSSFARRLLGEADLPLADLTAISSEIGTRLGALGWTPLDPARHSAVAQKEYETAVGPRMAFAYVQPFGSDSVMIQGNYDSEGRNVLDTSGVTVRLDAAEDALDQAVQSFAAKADAGVDASYARGLHVRHGIRAESRLARRLLGEAELPSEADEISDEDLQAAADFPAQYATREKAYAFLLQGVPEADADFLMNGIEGIWATSLDNRLIDRKVQEILTRRGYGKMASRVPEFLRMRNGQEFAESLLREDHELAPADSRRKPQIFSIPPRDEDEGTEFGQAQWFVGRFKPEGGIETLSEPTTSHEEALTELRAILAKPVTAEPSHAPQLPGRKPLRLRR